MGQTLVKQFFNVFTAEQCEHILALRMASSTLHAENLSDLLVYEDLANGDWPDVFKTIAKQMENVLSQYYNFFFDLMPKEQISISHIGFLNDKNGSFTELHYDWELVRVEKPKRIIVKPFVVLLYLNNVDEGGELFFPLQDVKFKPTLGSVVILPCNYTYPHLSMPVTKGSKHVCRITYKIDFECFKVDELEI